jgi:hypothetical protein
MIEKTRLACHLFADGHRRFAALAQRVPTGLTIALA